MNHPSFRHAMAWVEDRQGGPPPSWPPQGLARLDDTWFALHPGLGPRRPPEPAFGGLPQDLASRARAACGRALITPHRLPPTLCEVCARWCWSDLVDLEDVALDEPALIRQAADDANDDDDLAAALPRLSAPIVLSAVSLAGLDDLGGLLARAPDRAAATVCGRLPPAWRERVWQVRATGAPPGRAALAELTTLIRTGDPTEVLFSLGARGFGSLLSPRPLALRQTAQLLPVPVARHLLGAAAGTGSHDPAALAAALREAVATRK